MTCCVAALADGGKSIILISDRKIGTATIEAEPEVEKVLTLHRDWRVMYSGEDISPIFDIVDGVVSELRKQQTVTYKIVRDALVTAYQRKETEDAETLYLRPLGWTLNTFNERGATVLTLVDSHDINAKLKNHRLDIELLIAGFEGQRGIIFTMPGGSEHATTMRADNPGFAAIGSGSAGAEYMMMYRDMSREKPLREALYYAMEGKYFGELATGVGEDTDVHILGPGGKDTRLELETANRVFFDEHKLCWQLAPNTLTNKHKKVLNTISELKTFPKLPLEK